MLDRCGNLRNPELIVVFAPMHYRNIALPYLILKYILIFISFFFKTIKFELLQLYKSETAMCYIHHRYVYHPRSADQALI